MESHKITARFTAINATRIVSPAGDKCQNFEAGETAAVHRDMWSVAIAAGLMPEEPLADETVQIQTDAGIVEVPPVPVKKSQEEIVRLISKRESSRAQSERLYPVGATTCGFCEEAGRL